MRAMIILIRGTIEEHAKRKFSSTLTSLFRDLVLIVANVENVSVEK